MLTKPIARVSASNGEYPVYVARLGQVAGALNDAGLKPGPCLVISDERVWEHHGSALSGVLRDAGWQSDHFLVPSGEAAKSAAGLAAVYDHALEIGVDRGTPVLAFGGGVVGDLAGFAAATLLRGLPFVQIPTTLIAQTDAAIGGKTGINHAKGKNLIGSIYAPRLVYADPNLLATLEKRDLSSGLAETIKHALVADLEFLDDLPSLLSSLLGGQLEVLPALVSRSAAIKASIVSLDEQEMGLRSVLNFGHTFAHAIERVAGYGTFRHGEAVATGMRAALFLSREALGPTDYRTADDLVAMLPVPSGLRHIETSELMAAMLLDKKRVAGRLRLVVLDRLGHGVLDDHVSQEQVAAAWEFVKSLDA
ncbi:3-dehydroquinate synthase [soil metagenome]